MEQAILKIAWSIKLRVGAVDQSCKSGKAFCVGFEFGSGSSSGRVWRKTWAYFGPDTMHANKLSKNKIILLPYIYSM